MNGRLYDPEIGRVLSGDPAIQETDNAQNFNRYSYVVNNPLSLTDPSGYFFKKLFKSIGKLFSKIGKSISNFVKSAWKKTTKWLAENEWASIAVTIIVGIVSMGVGLAATAAIYGGSFAATFGAAATAVFNGGIGAMLGGLTTMQGVIVGAIGGALSGGVNAALAGGDLGDVFKGALIGGIQGAASAGIGHSQAFSAGGAFGGATGSAIAQTTAHGILGGAVNEAMGGKFQDGFLSAAAAKGATFMPGLGNFLKPGGGDTATHNILTRTALAATIGGTASALGGGKFANGAKTAAMQHLFNEEVSRAGAKLTYYVKERLLSFHNPQNGDSAIFKMDSGAADFRSGGKSTDKYPDMTNDPNYEGFKALSKRGPAGPLPRGDYRIAANGKMPSGQKSYALYPIDSSPGDLSILVKNPITGIMNYRAEFMIHLGTPGGIGCIVTPFNSGLGIPIYKRFESYMDRVNRSGSTYGSLTVKGSMHD